MIDIKKIIREELENFDWIKSNLKYSGTRWEKLLDVLDELVGDRPRIGAGYKRRENYKIWLGEISKEELQKLKDEVYKRGYKFLGLKKFVPDSLYITIDTGYSKKSNRIIFSVMGCKKFTTIRGEGEENMCDVVDGEYKIKKETLEYDKNYFENNKSQELPI
jgi:hypothetical protein